MPNHVRKKTKAVNENVAPIRCSALLLSRREVTVSGCRRITEYGSTQIRLSVCEGHIVIEGRGLTVHTYTGDELTVRGVISGIFFENLEEEKGL